MSGREPLWKVNDQAARLAELVSHAGDLKEAPLRRDVRSLGRLLGEVLKEQVGIEFFTAVEELRLLLIEHREARAQRESSDKEVVDEDQLMNRAQRIVNGLNISDAHRMAKAFAIYFELTNLAETSHRKRRRRAAQVSLERQAQPGTFLGTLLRMRAAGITEQQVLRWLRQVEVTVVLHSSRYTSSAMTSRLCGSASSSNCLVTSSEVIEPIGLLGLIKTSARVLLLISEVISSSDGCHPFAGSRW